METSFFDVPVFCELDRLLPPPQPERPRQIIKIELTNAPIFFITQTSFRYTTLQVRAKLRLAGRSMPNLAAIWPSRQPIALFDIQ
jgi:hypothetical protein